MIAPNRIVPIILSLALLGFATPEARADTAYQFDMPAQTLADALRALGGLTNTNIVFETGIVEGVEVPALQARMTLDEALEKLLAGTQLITRHTAPDTVVVRRERQEAKDATTGAGGPTSLVKAADPAQRLALADAVTAESSAAAAAAAAGGSGSLGGHVVDATSGSALAGALIRVLETGQTLTTDNLGAFRLKALPSGQYTLAISYLGYTEKLWPVDVGPDANATMDFPLEVSAWDVAEVTVFGTRSSRAIALNQQRTADNNQEVVSADLLGNFTGTTISEALRHVAGVTFQRDPSTGAGTNIMIRGLEPDMNAVKLNGLNLPVGNGRSRSANLNNVLADSVSKITISKTLLPSQDSAGTGGLVEIETKSPLERPERYFNLAVEGGRRGANFGDDYLVSATASRTLGERRNFGLSASAQYTQDTHNNSGYGTSLNFGQYLPLSPAGTPTFDQGDFDPRTDFPYEPGDENVYVTNTNVSFVHADSSTLAVTLSGEWRPTVSTNLRLDVQRSEARSSNFTARSNVQLLSGYQLRPVAALDGEVRRALTFAGDVYTDQSYSLTDGQSSATDTYSLRGSASRGRWDVNFTAGFAHGADRTPSSPYLSLAFETGAQSGVIFDESNFLPEAVDPQEGLIITPYPHASGKKVLLPLFTPDTWDFFNNADNYFLAGAGGFDSRGRNDRHTADINARYQLGWKGVEYIETGFNFEKARFSNSQGSMYIAPNIQYVFEPEFDIIYPSLAPLGMHFETTDLSRIGHSGEGFHYLDERGVRGFFDDVATYPTDVISSIQYFPPTALEKQTFTDEKNLAGYVQGKLAVGRLEIIGGVRLSQVQVRAVTMTGPRVELDGIPDPTFPAQDFLELLDESVTQKSLLPRVAVNFRQTDNLIYRGGYFLTTARPSIAQLSSFQLILLNESPTGGPFFNQQELLVSRGNPGLKPAVTHNFDVDVEYYRDDIGVIRLGAFYKRIDNSLQNNDVGVKGDLAGVELPDHEIFRNLDLDDVYVNVTQPENSKDPAQIWGAELHVERQFTFLPGLWNGLGMYVNFGYSDSKAAQSYNWRGPDRVDSQGTILSYRQYEFYIPGQRFNFQPKTSGTLALTYNKRGIDATLAYGFQDRYQNFFTPNNLDDFTEGVRTLDLHVAYFFELGGLKLRTFVEGTDLLKGPTDPDLLTSVGGQGGIGKYYTGGAYLGGREFRLGMSATF